MPRPDGFATNAELQQQFALVARDLYVAAFERDLQHRIPDWFIGKKLGHICLEIVRTCATPCDDEPISPKQIARERFMASAAFSGFTDFAQAEQELSGTIDEFELLAARCNDAEAERYGEAPLVPQFDVSGLPSSLLRSDYIAIPHNKKKIRHANALKDRPSKQSLVSAVYFMESALNDYVRTEDFTKDKASRVVAAILSGKPVTEYSHSWTVPYAIDVPINGKEPDTYLIGFLEYLAQRLEKTHAINQRSVRLNAPSFFIENNNNRIALLEQKQFEIIEVLQRRRLS